MTVLIKSIIITGLMIVFFGKGISQPASSDSEKLTQTNRIVVKPAIRLLTREEVVSLALKQNPSILKAKEEVQRTAGVTFEVRAAALPRLSANADLTQNDEYLQSRQNRVFDRNSDSTSTQISDSEPNQDQSTDEQWSIGLRFDKSLYDGGATRANIKIAKLTEQVAFYDFQETIQQILFDVRVGFDQVLLNKSLINVQEQNVKLLSEELQNQKNRFDAGTVPRFNVLRAEVALANAKPNLIRAKNDYRIALQNLARLLAIDYEDKNSLEHPPFELMGELSSDKKQIVLPNLLTAAMEKRPQLKKFENLVEREKTSITSAKAGYLPRLNAFATYGYRKENLADDFLVNDGGYTVGVQGSWNFFDGLATKGKVDQSRARFRAALVDFDDTRRQIELSVREAYSKYLEALELMESQIKNIEQAEESLRLAQSRFDAGAGTQLEVLDAQVALTTARSTALQARFDYNRAVAQINRAAGLDTAFQPFSNLNPADVKPSSSAKP